MSRDAILEPIRNRAYELWEKAGRPEGGDLEFWERARQELEAENAGAPASPNPAPPDPEMPDFATKD